MIAKNLAPSIRPELYSPASQGMGDEFIARLLLFRMGLPAGCLCLLIALFSLSFPTLANRSAFQWLPWLLSLFIFGLAHGGIDHQVPTMLRGIIMQGRNLVLFVALYLSLMMVVLMIWRWNPEAGLILFLLMSAYHFGQGDLYWSSAFGLHHALRAGTEIAGRRALHLPFLLLITRGSLPAILPFLFFPNQLAEITRLLSVQLRGVKIHDWLGATALRQGLIIGLLLFVFGQIIMSLRLAYARHQIRDAATVRAAMIEIVETGLLLLLFICAPPILAIGTYFLVWHSPRHVVRLILMTKSMQGLISQGQLGSALILFHRRALPLTAAASGLLLILWVTISRFQLSTAVTITSAFLFVSAITFPHFMLVLWMDTRQSLWGRNIRLKGETR